MIAAEQARRAPYGDEHEAFRETCARFLADAAADDPAALFAAAAGHGIVAMQVGEEHGGAGVDDPRFGAVLAEEAMRLGATGLALQLCAHNDVAVPVLLRHAALQRLAAWAPALAAGELIAAVATEPVAARAGAAVTLDGEARFVTGAAPAGVLVVAGRTGEGADDLVVCALEPARPGVDVRPGPPVFGPQGAGFADLRLSCVEVAGDDVLATGAQARELLDAARAAERLSLAVLSAAGARAALAMTVAYVEDRRAFGQPIARFENTQMVLGDLAAEVEVAGAYADACLIEHAAGGGVDLRRATVAKLRCTETFGRAVDAGVQLHGGYGYMVEYPISRAYEDARILRLLGGPSEALRSELAAGLGPASPWP